MAISLMQIKQELVVFLRNADILTTTARGVTTSSDTGTFSAAATHTLGTNPTLAKNVRSVVVGGSTLSLGDDYTVNYTTGVITFTVAQTGAYTISYDQGSADKIFPDFPQAHLTLSQFPRVAVDIIGASSNEFGIGAEITQTTYQVSIICYAKDQTTLEDLVSSVKSNLMSNKKNFYYSAFITPTSAGPLLVSEFGEKKIMQRNQDAEVRFSFDGI